MLLRLCIYFQKRPKFSEISKFQLAQSVILPFFNRLCDRVSALSKFKIMKDCSDSFKKIKSIPQGIYSNLFQTNDTV